MFVRPLRLNICNNRENWDHTHEKRAPCEGRASQTHQLSRLAFGFHPGRRFVGESLQTIARCGLGVHDAGHNGFRIGRIQR